MRQHDYPHLSSSGRIGRLATKNRIVMPPMGTNLASRNGEVTERLVAYYEERAAGGVGTLIVEVAAVHPGGRAIPRQIGIWDDEFVAGLSVLAKAIQKHGTVCAIQLHHAGRQTNASITGEQPVSASPLRCPVMQQVPRELSTREIGEIANAFGSAARRAMQAGFDAVELHGAHGYLINQFLSPYSNHRRDEYGGSRENRFRFAREIVEAVKRDTASDYPIIFRMSADEYMPGGLVSEDAQWIAQNLEQLGVSALHVSAGVYGSPAPMVPLMEIPPGPLVHLAEAIKSAVGVPVIAVSRLHQPELAEQVLRQGKADFIAMGRALITDPDLPNKVLSGRQHEVRTCICCNQGCLDRLLGEGLNASCVYNPRAGREDQFIRAAARTMKKVLVVGGGPAGMEAARTARERGHEVHLYEKSSELGGQTLLACRTPHKQEFFEVTRFYRNEMQRLGVKVHLNTDATIESISRVKPDVVVIASGSVPKVPEIEGLNRVVYVGEQHRIAQPAQHLQEQAQELTHRQPSLARAVQAWDVIDQGGVEGERIAVIGGGLVGCETAELLAEQGKHVTVFEMQSEVATDAGASLRAALLDRLGRSSRVSILTKREVIEVDQRTLRALHDGHEEEHDGFDAFVLAVGSLSDDSLADEVRAHGYDTRVVGDAREVAKLMDAVHSAFEAVYSI